MGRESCAPLGSTARRIARRPKPRAFPTRNDCATRLQKRHMCTLKTTTDRLEGARRASFQDIPTLKRHRPDCIPILASKAFSSISPLILLAISSVQAALSNRTLSTWSAPRISNLASRTRLQSPLSLITLTGLPSQTTGLLLSRGRIWLSPSFATLRTPSATTLTAKT